MLKKKAQGEVITVAPAGPGGPQVINLMEAL